MEVCERNWLNLSLYGITSLKYSQQIHQEQSQAVSPLSTDVCSATKKLQQCLAFQHAVKSRNHLPRPIRIMSESCSSLMCPAMQILHVHELELFTLTVKHSQ